MNKSEIILKKLLEKYPDLTACEAEIKKAYESIVDCYKANGKLLIAGNGGSCSDAGHIVGELMKEFLCKRSLPESLLSGLHKLDNDYGEVLIEKLQGALPAIDLTANSALITAFSNDVDDNLVFAQQIIGYGRRDDIFIGISTSGSSKNILYAMYAAKAAGLTTIALTGGTGGQLIHIADIAICVPKYHTVNIQELHLPVYHALCAIVEDKIFNYSS